MAVCDGALESAVPLRALRDACAGERGGGGVGFWPAALGVVLLLSAVRLVYYPNWDARLMQTALYRWERRFNVTTFEDLMYEIYHTTVPQANGIRRLSRIFVGSFMGFGGDSSSDCDGPRCRPGHRRGWTRHVTDPIGAPHHR